MTPALADDFDKELDAPERLPDAIDTDTLRKYFTLTQPDLDHVHQCRGAVNKLGFAVQLCTLRWQGAFLPDTRALPAAVIETLAVQLGVLPLPIDAYPQNAKTRWEHLERIRLHLGLCHAMPGSGSACCIISPSWRTHCPALRHSVTLPTAGSNKRKLSGPDVRLCAI
jgi:hypothetical protein